MPPLEVHDKFSVQLTPPSIANAPPIATTTVAYVNRLQPSRKHENTNQRSDLEAELSLLYEFRDLLLSEQLLGDANLIVVKCSHHKTTADMRTSTNRVRGPWVVPDPGLPLPPPPLPACPHPSVHIGRGSEWDPKWTTTEGLTIRSNSWADYTQRQSAYDEYHRTWQEKKDAYDAFQLLSSRAHVTIVLWFRPAEQGLTGQPPQAPRCYATYHLYSRRDRPQDGLQTYTYATAGGTANRRGSPWGTPWDARALTVAITNARGMVGPDGRIG